MFHISKSITRSHILPSISKSAGKRNKSSSPLAGDSGSFATHTYHKINTALVVLTPLYFVAPVPDAASKAFGVIMAGSLSLHSWVGMNYVMTDYIPKISKGLLGPARVVSAGLSAVILLGLGKVALNDHGGIKGTVMGLWTKKEVSKEKQ